jgi:AcrR family transcriptional regulator
VPLLLRHGPALTTRQIAEACDVAEGTIFRVFPDKDSLIEAVIEAAMDPAPFEADLARIDPSEPLEARLLSAVTLLQDRLSEIGQLMTAAGVSTPPSARRGDRPPPNSVEALARVFEPDAADLSLTPRECAIALRGITFAGTHPAFAVDGPWPPSRIVALALEGMRGC